VNDRNGRGRIGPWRLLDLMQATMPWRSSMMGGGAVLPEYGPPDSVAPIADPALELPGSNIGDGEWRQAVERERSRRDLGALNEERGR
jgi:hypothetical protein